MLFSVDFSVQVNGSFCTIHSAFIHAVSVSECMDIAEDMKESLPANKKQYIRIFIEN